MAKITKIVRNSTESFFGGGCGAIIPFRHIATEEVREKSPAEGIDHDLYSPIPFDAFPGSDPDPVVMETILNEVVAERIARGRTNVSSEPKGNSLFELSWNEPIDLYYAGDSIGAMAEGSSGGTVPFEKAITGLQAFPNGTDEADTARLFLRHCNEVDVDNFDVLDWYAYHTRHRAATSYGKTWRDHFNTVDYILKKNGQLDYNHLLQLSKDRDSNGNGCLALVYPIATLFGVRAQEVAEERLIARQINAVDCLYLTPLYRAESGVAEHLHRLLQGKPPWGQIDTDKTLPWVQEQTGLTLSASQQEAIILALSSKITRFGTTFSPNDKIIQMVNNYDKEVFNGDIGTIIAIDMEEGELTVDYDGRLIPYEFGELDEVALAYATSTHKAQGSEYPAVVIPLAMQHYTLLQRNLVYTGVTRGKQLVVIIGQTKALGMAIRNHNVTRRLTGLQQMLSQPTE